MALNETQEALLEGARTLRHRAERLGHLGFDSAETNAQISSWRKQAELLDKLACADIGGVEMSTTDGDA